MGSSQVDNFLNKSLVISIHAFLFTGTPYEKVLDGYICSNVHAEIPSPPECEQAAKSLGLVWKGEFYGSGTNNFPACLYSAATKTVLFNKNPRPERNVNLNPKYAAICKKGKIQ